MCKMESKQTEWGMRKDDSCKEDMGRKRDEGTVGGRLRDFFARKREVCEYKIGSTRTVV